MPIDFPNNPISGQTYSYGINRWIYNGVAWDKLDNHPGISAGNQISVGYQESLSGASFSINVIEGNGSDLDADLLDGVSGERFIENLQTGILYGGLVSINAGNTATFDVSAGAGIIVNIGGSTTGYPTPTLTNVSWTAKTGVTTGYLGSTEETFISINSSGNLVLQSTVWSETQYESQIPIGTLFHHGTGYIDLAISIPHVSYGQAQQFDPFIRAFGPLKLNGYELTGSTADFKIYKSSGKAYLMGRNYAVDPNNPNVVTDTASNPVQYYYMFYRDGSGGFDTTILTTGTDVTNYDDGTGILNSVPSGKYTTQKIFGLPNQPNVIGIYYGREIYNSLEDAKANIQYETFSESEATSTQGVFLGYLVCKANATNLGTTGDHEFIASGLFRNTANIGGGGLAFSALTDLSDVNISSPSNNDALVYDSSTSAWVNKSFSNLPVVTSLNGSTGAIVGVNSVRGLTGAVGITNGSGIGLSVSGQTMTFSNTGVLSIDGGTGAITNVAKTNVDNLFSASQTITAANAVLAIVDSSSFNEVSFQGEFNRLYFYNDLSGGEVFFGPTIAPASTITVSLPAFTTTLAGLAGTQTFTGTNTFSALTNFPGGISAAGATFSSLVRFNAGISAAGGTFGSSGVYVGGNITTSSSGAIESGFNGHFRGLQWIDPFGGRSRIVHNYNSFPHSIDFRVHGASFDASGEINRMQIFASGVSFSQGATFRNSINITGNVIASGGISAAGGTFNTNISVNGARIGRTGSNYLFGQDVALTLTTGTNNFLLGASAGHGITSQSNNIAIGNNALRSTTPRERCVALGDSALLNNTQNDSVAIGFNAAYNNTGQYTVALGTEALFNNSANTCMAMGYGALKNNAASGNVAVGPFALNGNNNAAASNNIAIGSNTLFANQGGFRNVAIGNDTLVGGAAYTGQQGARNTVIGHLAGFNNRIGNENVFIGNESGHGNSSGSKNVFIGSGACGSTSGTTTREIVIGANAVGLGSNTAVIGATSQTSATIYGLLVAPSGISAAGGTFSGTISLNGQTFTNVVHGLNGYTGNIGAPQWPVGQTSGALTVVTFPSGVTSFSTKIPFYLPYQNVSAAGSITGTVSTNRVYFTLFNTPRTINIHTLRFSAFNTGITGSCHFGIYSADSDAGLPKSLLYSSASTIVGSGFAATSVTNASGLLTISPGYFYIAVVFNNTPTLYGLNNAQLPIFGSNQYTAGYLNSSPFADMSGFTLPTSLPASGVTFGLIDYIPGAPALRGVFTEYRIV